MMAQVMRSAKARVLVRAHYCRRIYNIKGGWVGGWVGWGVQHERSNSEWCIGFHGRKCSMQIVVGSALWDTWYKIDLMFQVEIHNHTLLPILFTYTYTQTDKHIHAPPAHSMTCTGAQPHANTHAHIGIHRDSLSLPPSLPTSIHPAYTHARARAFDV